jgi:hypothetical protein
LLWGSSFLWFLLFVLHFFLAFIVFLVCIIPEPLLPSNCMHTLQTLSLRRRRAMLYERARGILCKCSFYSSWFLSSLSRLCIPHRICCSFTTKIQGIKEETLVWSATSERQSFRYSLAPVRRKRNSRASVAKWTAVSLSLLNFGIDVSLRVVQHRLFLSLFSVLKQRLNNYDYLFLLMDQKPSHGNLLLALSSFLVIPVTLLLDSLLLLLHFISTQEDMIMKRLSCVLYLSLMLRFVFLLNSQVDEVVPLTLISSEEVVLLSLYSFSRNSFPCCCSPVVSIERVCHSLQTFLEDIIEGRNSLTHQANTCKTFFLFSLLTWVRVFVSDQS